MSDKTNIEWTDATWNPVRGCSRVSAGCVNCYAERVAARFSGPGMPYEGLAVMRNGQPRWTGTMMVVEKHMLDPLKWRRPRRIFTNSMSDLFHENLSDETIDRVFAVMAIASRHTFQVLTKRPKRMLAYLSHHRCEMRVGLAAAEIVVQAKVANRNSTVGNDIEPRWPLPHVWLGVSAENQETADQRIPILLDTPAKVRFVSAEPLLGPICFQQWPTDLTYIDALSGKREQIVPATMINESTIKKAVGPRLDWVIVGGESGPGARPMVEVWAREIVEECAHAGVACFVKQMGLVYAQACGNPVVDPHGAQCIPADLMVRQFPITGGA